MTITPPSAEGPTPETPELDAVMERFVSEGPAIVIKLARDLECRLAQLADDRDCIHLFQKIGKLTTQLEAERAKRLQMEAQYVRDIEPLMEEDGETPKHVALAAQLEAERDRADELEELHRMQLTAIDAVSFCNTYGTLAQNRVAKDNPYWTSAYESVFITVEREIQERVAKEAAEARAAAMERENQSLQEKLDVFTKPNRWGYNG